MSDLAENDVTAAVLDSFSDTPDPRLKCVLSSLVRHLHGFVRDVDLSFAEWRYAIDFLTRTGQMCDDKRQEFILLSDTLGVSMLVDAINHRAPADATQTTVLGPFYVENPPVFACGADLAAGRAGETLLVEGSVSSADGRPLENAVVDVWHSDQEGFYDVQDPARREPSLRGRLRTDAAGRFHFWTVMPRWYPIPDDGPVGQMLTATRRHPNRPAHVHFMIAAPGYETLVTHIFSDDSPYLDSDAVFGVKDALIRPFSREPAGSEVHARRLDHPWRRLSYDFKLHGPAGLGQRT